MLLLQAGIGCAAFRYLIPIAIVVCVLMVIVVDQLPPDDPRLPVGRRRYIVSRENLGHVPSLVAGSSLLVDYILTVAVSVAGGVLAIRTATGFDTKWTVPVCLLCVLLMTVVNLRGVKESGAAFAGPTYFYILMLVMLLVTGLYRVFVQHLGPIPTAAAVGATPSRSRKETKDLGLLMLLRAFSSGAVALSGVEAVSNGVPAFQKPESKNAATTLMWMGGILGVCFLGVSVLASHLKPFRGPDDGNGLGLMAEHIYGGKGVHVLAHDDRHVRDLDPRGQHRVRRLPRAGVDHRQGRLPAPAVLQPRRPAGVLQRRHLPGGDRQHPDRRLQRRHLQADPALRVRRVHRLHAQPGRAWSATTSSTRRAEWRVEPGDQRHRCGRHRRSSPWSSWSRSSPKGRGSRPR